MKNFINIHVAEPIIETCNFDEILDFVKSNPNIYNKIFVSAGVATALVTNNTYNCMPLPGKQFTFKMTDVIKHGEIFGLDVFVNPFFNFHSNAIVFVSDDELKNIPEEQVFEYITEYYENGQKLFNVR